MSIPTWLSGKSKLTTEEQQLRDRCEVTIKIGIQAFATVGGALQVIREKQLYRSTHDSFAGYCEGVFNLSERRCNQLIESSQVCEALKMTAPGVTAPTHEAQVRPLAGLPVGKAVEAWTEAVEAAAPKAPSGVAVKAAADKRRPGKKAPKAAKPIRFKVPGATVIVVPNKKAWSGDVSAALTAAIDRIHGEYFETSKAA